MDLNFSFYKISLNVRLIADTISAGESVTAGYQYRSYLNNKRRLVFKAKQKINKELTALGYQWFRI